MYKPVCCCRNGFLDWHVKLIPKNNLWSSEVHSKMFLKKPMNFKGWLRPNEHPMPIQCNNVI